MDDSGDSGAESARRARSRLIGINHVALEVGDLDAALELYGRLFELELRGRSPGMAFIDLGDQFLAISEGRTQEPDRDRHFGIVVEDQPVTYSDVQFERTEGVKRKLGIEDLSKSDAARAEIRDAGMD